MDKNYIFIGNNTKLNLSITTVKEKMELMRRERRRLQETLRRMNKNKLKLSGVYISWSDALQRKCSQI